MPVQHQGVANPGPQVSGLELGGLAGSLSSGYLSDYLMKRNKGANPKGNVGIRVQVGLPAFFAESLQQAAALCDPGLTGWSWSCFHVHCGALAAYSLLPVSRVSCILAHAGLQGCMATADEHP